MGKKKEAEVKEVVTGPTLLLVGFDAEAAGVVQAQLGRFGVTVVTGDCASATYVAQSADDLARIYSQFHKSFTPPEPVVAEPVATVATEQPVFLAPDFEVGVWGDEQR
jgi:hypothetical protein